MIGVCTQCENPFQYEFAGKQRRVCNACRELNGKQALRRARERIKNLATEEKGKRLDLLGVTRMDRSSVGGRLGITDEGVRRLERNALRKIRAHPQAKELYRLWKEEGGPVPAAETHVGDELLDYQLALSEWWETYDKILAMGAEEEALECLECIRNFQATLNDAIVPRGTDIDELGLPSPLEQPIDSLFADLPLWVQAARHQEVNDE